MQLQVWRTLLLPDILLASPSGRGQSIPCDAAVLIAPDADAAVLEMVPNAKAGCAAVLAGADRILGKEADGVATAAGAFGGAGVPWLTARVETVWLAGCPKLDKAGRLVEGGLACCCCCCAGAMARAGASAAGRCASGAGVEKREPGCGSGVAVCTSGAAGASELRLAVGTMGKVKPAAPLLAGSLLTAQAQGHEACADEDRLLWHDVRILDCMFWDQASHEIALYCRLKCQAGQYNS